MFYVANKGRLESGDSPYEENKAISFDVYNTICRILFKGKGGDHLFVHSFFTIEWNILARSEIFFGIHVKHVERRDNYLLFFFPNQRATKMKKILIIRVVFTLIQRIPNSVQSCH